MAEAQQQPDKAGTPPTRFTDRIERVGAWLLSTLGVLGALVVLFFAENVHTSQLDQARRETASRSPTSGVLLRDTGADLAASRALGGFTVTAPIRWTDRDGVVRVGETVLAEPMKAGDTVTVWTDRENRLAPAPASADDAMVAAVVVTFWLLLALITGLVLAWTGLRRWTLARNCALWELEWAEVEPRWSGRARGESMS